MGQSDADREKLIVDDTIQRVSDLITDRAPLNAQCEEVASLILPTHVGTFFSPGMIRPYVKKTDQQIDSNGALALDRFMAICDSMLTPKNQTYQGLAAGGKHRRALMKDRATRLWFFEATRVLFDYRYAATANFTGQNQNVWTSLGGFGNGGLLTEKYYDVASHVQGLRYMSVPFGSIYFEFNHQGNVDGFIQMRRLKARVAAKMPEYAGVVPPQVLEAAMKSPNKEFIFLWRVCPRDDYKPWRIDSKNMPYASYHICMDTKTFMRESGYNTFPLSATQFLTAPGEDNGQSPAMRVLPSLKTINAQKRVFLQQGHRAGAPVLLLSDDGLMNMNLKPGAQNRGAWSADGKPLVGVLPSGDIQITENMMAMEKQIIDSAFMVDLFNIALDRKSGTTATEVIDEINKRGILIAPTLGRQEQYLSHLTDRDLALLGEMKALPPMPPLLKEADGEYSVVFMSPLAKAMRSGDVGGFFRTVEMVKEVINITGDQSLLDPFDFDTALPEIAQINGSPEPWMASPDKIAAKRDARAKAAQMQNQIAAAPGAAGLISAQAKAAAVQQKGGVNPANRDLTAGAPPAAQ